MRVRDGLATSRLHAARREHRANHPATTPRHDHLIITLDDAVALADYPKHLADVPADGRVGSRDLLVPGQGPIAVRLNGSRSWIAGRLPREAMRLIQLARDNRALWKSPS
jgi:hypothetical protein